MPRKRAFDPLLPLSATLAWNRLGLQWIEMVATSGHVIARRTRRNNSPAQLFRMGNEKAQAAIESSHAMTRAMMRMPGSDPLALWNAWAATLAGGLAPYRSRVMRNARTRRSRR